MLAKVEHEEGGWAMAAVCEVEGVNMGDSVVRARQRGYGQPACLVLGGNMGGSTDLWPPRLAAAEFTAQRCEVVTRLHEG